MKILITSDWYAPVVNGVVTSILCLKQELEKRGHQVRVLTLSSTRRSYQQGEVTYLGSVSVNGIYPQARLRTAMARKLVKDLIAWHPDIVHSQCEFSTFFPACKIAKKLNIPLVHTYHTVYEDYTHYFSPSEKLGRSAVSAFSRWVGERADCILAPTQKVKNLLEGYQVKAPVQVLPTGIRLERFSEPVSKQKLASLRAQLSIPAGNRILVSVCRLAEEKNVDELLDAMTSLKGQPVTLLLVGDGPYRPQLEERTAQLGLQEQVRFAGMVKPDQVAQYYKLGDLFVSASTSETQGLTYIEALAAGVPLCCRKDPCLEGVVNWGENGWFFQTPTQRDELLQHFLQAKPDDSLRRRASESAEPFSAAQFAQKAEQIYYQCIGAKQKPSCPAVQLSPQTLMLQKVFSAISIAGLLGCVAFAVFCWNSGMFHSPQLLQQTIAQAGWAGAVLFVAFQAVQVVLPVLPGGLGCLAGVLMFGPVLGFVYNYVGICAGSLAAFAIARVLGRPMLYRLFSPSTIEKYSRWTGESKRFSSLFALAIFFPVAPDDFLCYLAGTTPMPWSRFTAVILLGKPFAIALYSLGLTLVWGQVTAMIA